jgi:quercetin dioxygenase-like cupin family protein
MARPTVPVREEDGPAWVDVAEGVRMRRMVEAQGTTIAMYQVRPGTRFAVHSHAYGELCVVLSGSGRALLGSDYRELHTGDACFVPPDVPHGFVAEGGLPVLLLNVTIPLRPDMESLTAETVQKLAMHSTVPGMSDLGRR